MLASAKFSSTITEPERLKAATMKHPRHLKTLFSTLCLAACAAGIFLLPATPAPAQFPGGGPLDWRRTLFAPFGQVMLHFEAPLGMCFLDQTDPVEAGAINLLREELRTRSRQTLVAVFADCLQIAAIGKDVEGNDLGDVGLVTWLNEHGEKAPVGRDIYLDMRADTLPNHTRAGLAGYLRPVIDDQARRTPDGVSLAFTAETEIAYQTFRTVGITGAALIRQFPVDFMITHTAKTPQKDKKELYELMDRFLAQQMALNAVE
jgi:hypothetical protein